MENERIWCRYYKFKDGYVLDAPADLIDLGVELESLEAEHGEIIDSFGYWW